MTHQETHKNRVEEDGYQLSVALCKNKIKQGLTMGIREGN